MTSRSEATPATWLPIETAPKDGIGKPVIGAAFGRYPMLEKVWWQPEFDAWIAGAREMVLATGYTFEDGSDRKLHSAEIREPTHWMPLPEPPNKESDGSSPLNPLYGKGFGIP